MRFVTKSNAQSSIVYSVAWLCGACTTNPDVRNLAIGGEPYNRIDIQTLKFDAANEKFARDFNN